MISTNTSTPTESTTYPVHIIVDTRRSDEWVDGERDIFISSTSSWMHAFTDRDDVDLSETTGVIRDHVNVEGAKPDFDGDQFNVEDGDFGFDGDQFNVEDGDFGFDVELETLDGGLYGTTHRLATPVAHVDYDPDEDEATWRLNHDHPLVADGE